MQHTAHASAADDQAAAASDVVPTAPLQSVTIATTTKAVNIVAVSIVAESNSTISAKEIGTMTTVILDLDKEMGKSFLSTPTMLFKFDEWISKQSSPTVPTNKGPKILIP
ncbi:hypothetical protein V6N13_133827 [Hibiscus sabdariffa]|uniref:Uncharacterized protein n=1 Tax=Hibiscus sabdariffa TaxID=183260 RepID=A0ABR2R0M6_9ROSI